MRTDEGVRFGRGNKSENPAKSVLVGMPHSGSGKSSVVWAGFPQCSKSVDAGELGITIVEVGRVVR